MIKYEHHRSFKKGKYMLGVAESLCVPSHLHHSYEYVTVMSGQIKMQVGAEKLILNEGESVFVMPGQIHSYDSEGGTASAVALGIFSVDLLPELYTMPRSEALHSPITSGAPTAADILTVKDDKFLVKARLYELASAYLRGAPYAEIASAADGFAARILDFLEKHYTEPISLRHAASALGYNYQYLSGMINGGFGTSFTKLLSEYRITHACDLLRDTELGITKISAECGFDSIRNFNRVFRDFCGCTPSEYRKADISDTFD